MTCNILNCSLLCLIVTLGILWQIYFQLTKWKAPIMLAVSVMATAGKPFLAVAATSEYQSWTAKPKLGMVV
jgi:hypothetical protein